MVEGTEGIRRNLFTQEQSKEKTGAAWKNEKKQHDQLNI
jgi:hypothetical protein